MEKRVLVTVVISVAILFGWTFIQQRYFPPPPPTESPAAPTAPATPAASNEGAKPAGATPSKPAGERVPEKRATIERPGQYRAVFSSVGASPVEFTLLDPQYRRVVDGKETQIEMVPPQGALPFRVEVHGSGDEVELPADASWTVVRQSDEELVYAADAGALHVEKRWTIPRQGYALGLEVSVENRGPRPVNERLAVTAVGYQDPTVKPGGLLSFGRRYNLTEGLCDVGGKLKHEGLEASEKKPLAETGEVRWIGTGEQFFVSAVAFAPDGNRSCEVSGDALGRITSRALFEQRTIAPGTRVVEPMAAFIGPKLLHQLDAVKVGGVDARLGDAVNYTLEFVARPMFLVLKAIHVVVRNWGVAIIVITILMKLVLLYPTQKSMKSMKEMAKLKPKLDAIKERYPDDKQRQNLETMALYKQHGINPLGGCLPMLIQMPIYIAFYSMLGNAVELYRASFVWPITDLTAPAPGLAVVTGALMFLQQRSSPTARDPQQRTMMYMMPVMFTVFTLMLPSGLTLYILVNTLLTMLHQWWMNRADPKPANRGPQKSGAPKPARA